MQNLAQIYIKKHILLDYFILYNFWFDNVEFKSWTQYISDFLSHNCFARFFCISCGIEYRRIVLGELFT